MNAVQAARPASAHAGAAVRLDRRGAVGWRDVALDGLNCYLRGVEAILRGAGLGHDEVVDALGGHVTDRFGRDGRPHVRLRGGELRWLQAAPDAHCWNEVAACLGRGEPVVIWPDGFSWPGSRFEGRRHVHDHAILAVAADDGSLHYLDTEADEASGFTAEAPLTDATRRACTRVLRVRPPSRPSGIGAARLDRMIGASVRPLARLAAATAEYARWWRIEPFNRRLATALDVWALSDLQPPLYLLATISRRFGREPLATRAFEAAAQAKKVSVFVHALNRIRPLAPYDLLRDDLALLAKRLETAGRAAAAAAGQPPPAVSAELAGAWLWRRLQATSRWHFNVGLGSSAAYLRAPVSAAYGPGAA